MVHVQLCKKYQIHPRVLQFASSDSQSLDNPEDPQGERSNKRRKQVFDDDQLSEPRRQVYRSDEQEFFDYNKYVDSHMAWYEGRIDKTFQLFSQQLSRDGHRHNTGKVQPESLDNKPSALFCFDEALSLLTPSDISFVSLRRALRHQSMPKGNSGNYENRWREVLCRPTSLSLSGQDVFFTFPLV